MPKHSANLNDLPVVKGFRQRGMEMTRIETFTDAAFAFALTLLVVSIGAEQVERFSELLEALWFVPAFAIGAVLLMIFWHGHHVWSRRYGLDDGMTIVLSTLLVFVVLVYVVPLRFMTMGMVVWVKSGFGARDPELGQNLLDIGDINTLFVVYGVGFAALGGVMILLNLHAWRRREQLELNTIERHETVAEIGSWAILTAVGLLSVAVAALQPKLELGIPGWIYMLLPIVMPIYGTRMNRKRDQLAAKP